ncbi:FAD-binding oxidoreductase [Conexibacter woesei]|uniref:FAD-binding oxidoreductase n=1 Tax=Conexibacter woesei TaxID=191495 RepID=UPI0003F621D5|nr:FAD-binding oxidoreductase [Conexibacter woesei]
MRLFRRGDDGYEQARVGRVFNARRPERYPAAVLLAESEDDVVAGVRLAAREGWRVSVRSGGHSWAAWSVRDDALLIDLGSMKDMTFDALTGVATANPAVRGGMDLAPFLDAHGRMFPGGHCESVGIGGFLLQGGQGWNSRQWGWGCENVVGVDVVTADGSLVHANAIENTDLYWAARGSGPGFPGVITRFHLKTYDKPAAFTQDTWTFRLEDLEELLSWLHDELPSLDRIVEPVVAATRLPDVPLFEGVTRPDGPVLLLHTTAMCASAEQAEALLAALEPPGALAARALGHVRGLTTIAEENAAQAVQNPEQHRYAVDCTWSDATAEQLAPALREVWANLPTEHSFSIWYGWAPVRALPDMAFSVEANVYLATYVIYTDEADDETYRSWVHSRTADLAAAGGAGRGVYLGDTDFTRRSDRFMSDANYTRLEQIRSERDPDGRICAYLIDPSFALNAG